MYSSKRVTSFELPEDIGEIKSEIMKLEKLLNWIPAERQEKINTKSDFSLMDIKKAIEEIKTKNWTITSEAKKCLDVSPQHLLRYVNETEAAGRISQKVKAEMTVLREIGENIIPRLFKIFNAKIHSPRKTLNKL